MRLLRDLAHWALQVLVAYGILFFAMLVHDEDPGTLSKPFTDLALGLVFFGGFALLALVALGAPPEPTVAAMLPVLVVGSAPWPDRHWAFGAAVAWLVLHLATCAYVLLRGFRRSRARATA